MYDVKFFTIKYEGGLLSGKYVKDKEIDSIRITAKYGANISKKWPGGLLATSPGGSTFQASIGTMPLGGKEFFKTDQGNAKADSTWRVWQVTMCCTIRTLVEPVALQSRMKTAIRSPALPAIRQ